MKKIIWMEVFQDLINRGLKKVLMFICPQTLSCGFVTSFGPNDFKGISEAIKAFFPYSDIQNKRSAPEGTFP